MSLTKWAAWALLGLLVICAGCDEAAPEAECRPGAAERCGGGDEDCDGLVDEPGAEGCSDFRLDGDGDGRADGDTTRCLCAPTAPWTLPASVTPCGDCDDGNPCTTDGCGADGACTHGPREGSCEDLDPCTVDTTCTDGVCGGGTALDCDDGNPCTTDLCNAGLGCAHAANFKPCDDGDRCTSGDTCAEGRCQGTPTPSCGEPYCGDGTCGEGESCADCEADCSPLGFGRCGAACDPLAPSCGLDAVCVPTSGGALARDVLFAGNGVCGAGCERNADCASGACLRLEGLEGGGVCRPACAPASPACGEGETCVPTGEGGVGACNLGGVCTSGSADACAGSLGAACFARPGGSGVCLATCSVQAPGACGDEPCLARRDEALQEGICLSEDAPCDPTDGSGCPAGEACVLVGGAGFGGAAALCQPMRGAALAGEACSNDLTACGAGLMCWRGACVVTCDPALPRCANGATCLAIGGALGATDVALGICQGGCGDGSCTGEEDCLGCPSDCGACPVACGDGRCVPGAESCESCAEDCGECPRCGDGLCVFGREDCASCAEDCGACRCGDGLCSSGEGCVECQADCGACACGDGRCEGAESCRTCRADCGACGCGDGICGPGEDCDECPADCGACPCGDGECQRGETCSTCPSDCKVCLCGDGECAATESSDTCPADCAAACGDGKCTTGETCDSCAGDCGECACGDGQCNGDEACETCPDDCGACMCGDGRCNGAEDCELCPADCGACRCGDGSCARTETCTDCEADCGPCRGDCGDGFCQDDESCVDCQVDCGPCQIVCGDELCVPGAENCESCPSDCETCPAVCGDGVCAAPEETCLGCPGDCGYDGVASCAGRCDPMAPSCPTNHVCAPSVDGGASPLDFGEGLCAAACDADGDCEGGVCVALRDELEGRVCVQGRTCDPTNPGECGEGHYCAVSEESQLVGYCVQACDGPETCDAGAMCVGGRGGIWSLGVCVGQPDQCNPGTQQGCPADQTCTVFATRGQPPLALCTRRVGSAALGEPCGRTDDPSLLCLPGLLCDDDDRVCRRPCEPGSSCADGTCVDQAPDIMPGVMGVCR